MILLLCRFFEVSEFSTLCVVLCSVVFLHYSSSSSL